MLPLEFLDAGQEARIVAVDGAEETVTRLGEMGLQAGTFVRMIRPGSPCIIAVDDHRLSFRSDAPSAMILVEIAHHDSATDAA